MISILKKYVTLLLLLTISVNFSACVRAKLLGGIDEKGEKIFLTPADQIPDSIEHFIQTQDISNEDCRINYLLYRIERSNLTFMRNRVAYASSDAASFLRWKLNRPRWRPLIKTAREFIIIITSGSVMSGQPYQIIFPSKKTRHELKPILINELDFLEEYLKLKAEEEQKKLTPIQETIQKVADTIAEKREELAESQKIAENEPLNNAAESSSAPAESSVTTPTETESTPPT